MVERGLNIFWVVLGGYLAVHAWGLGVLGPDGPGSGMFPFLSGIIILGAGLALVFRRIDLVENPEWPTGIGAVRVLGVIAGLAIMAASLDYVGFATAGVVTMLLLLRFVERANWLQSIALSVLSVAGTIWLFDYMLGMPLPRSPWGWY